jgi:preprotein translocase subunit SecA
METLEKIWETIGLFFSGLLRGFERAITSLFGSSNARYVKRVQPTVDAVNELEPRYRELSNQELRAQTDRFRERLRAGETLDDLLVEAFAVCREAGRRFLGMRHYDVQLIGGVVLHRGSIAEMVTGEGKTLVATLPAYLNALEGKGVHVVTVNDYLARRDMEWMGPLYMGLGLTVGAIQSDMKVLERQKAYSCDITYGTNNEFGFDYLRDNMRPAARGDDRYPKEYQQSQGKLNYAIVDEVDNILIDEARTPLIISGPAYDDVRKYAEADRIARQLKRDRDFIVNEKDHTANLTDDGVREAERLAGVESFYTAGNMEWPHLIDNALKAHYLYQKDVRYVIKDGRIVIVDEFTGRLMEGRQWSDGLHQAVEAKEGVKIKEETQTLATITLQNFFKLYNKISGMTGTAMTEAGEFWKIYELEVIAIPTNKPMRRIEHPDVIYRTEREKFRAVADEVERINRFDVVVTDDREEIWGTIVKEQDEAIEIQPREKKHKDTIPQAKIKEVIRKGRPILIGTVSIEKSEALSAALEKRGVKHQVLNAKHHKREAEIIAQAGRLGAVTIATNMAGRGTDIVLGGNPETMPWARLQDKYATRLDVPREEWDALITEIETQENMRPEGEYVKSIGGLHVMGTERHDARRIDLQLRGRCGRQGDPGSSRFFLSLEDDLMRIFAGEWVKKILETLGMQEGEAIESRMVTRRIEAAQKKVEERHFESRKHLLEYDEVMDEQRKRVYSYRQRILDGANCRQLVLDAVQEQIDHHLGTYLDRNFGIDSFSKWAGKKLATTLEARDFRGMDFQAAQAYAKDEAERFAESQLLDAIEENLPDVEGAEESGEWNWQALTKFVNSRWGLNLRDRDLKREGRSGVAELILERAREAVQRVDLSDGAVFLEEDFGLKSAIRWVRSKFGIELEFEEVDGLEPGELKQLVYERAEREYDEKEAEYPVMAAMLRFSARGSHGHLDREPLAIWARDRFETDVSLDDFKHKQREEMRAILVEQSRVCQRRAAEMRTEAMRRVEELFGQEADDQDRTAGLAAGGDAALGNLVDWLNEHVHGELQAQDLERLDREALERKVIDVVEERYRPEMRRMERSVLLQIVDTAWKDNLLAMDHLRSAIGLVGYAQVDPKVEYKREGMKQFEQMWNSIGERVTDLIFRMEQLDEGFVGSTWVETSATHAQAETASDMARQQESAIQNSQNQAIETIRNRGPRVGRNDPCPCGSGKKYKQCCMRKIGAA